MAEKNFKIVYESEVFVFFKGTVTPYSMTSF